jgi:hypothetical protein
MAWGCQAGAEPAVLATMHSKTDLKPTESHASIKPGIDAHAKSFYVARQLDGATPQPVQKMSFEGLLRFAAKQQCRQIYPSFSAPPASDP